MSRQHVAIASRKEIQHLAEEVVRIVRNHFAEQPLQIYMFGSWAEGTALSTSDLDIAIDLGHPAKLAQFRRIIEEVDGLPTLRKVDLLDVQLVARAFRERIKLQGELIYAH